MAGVAPALAHRAAQKRRGGTSAAPTDVVVVVWHVQMVDYWKVGLLRRRKSYRAAFRVEQYRAAAQALRSDDPETYWRVVEQATGSNAEAAARRDPDAFVALFLAEARDAGVIKGESSGTEAPKSDRDYWPHLDLQGVLDRVADVFAQNEADRGGPLVYPTWAVRRYVAVEVLREAALSEPKINSDLLMIPRNSGFMDEDPQLDEEVDRLLRLHHLEEPVNVVVDALTGEGG